MSGLERCPGCGVSRVLFVARNGLCLDCVGDDELDVAPEPNAKASRSFQKPNSRPRRPKELPPCPGGGKTGYGSHAKARSAIRAHAPGKPALHAYECPNCGYWHITSQSRARRAS